MSESEVVTAIDNGVLTITLNRPEARNAANRGLADGLTAAIDELESNPELRVAVLTGAGGTFLLRHGSEGICQRRNTLY